MKPTYRSLRESTGLAAIAVIAVFALYSSATSVLAAWNGEVQYGFDAEFEGLAARLDLLRPHLPAYGELGYIHLDEHPPESMIPIKAFMYSQNRLAPLVLDMDLGYDLVIGDFPSSTSREEREAAIEIFDLRIVRDFDNGLMLLAHGEAE